MFERFISFVAALIAPVVAVAGAGKLFGPFLPGQSSYGAVNSADVDTLARTMWGEARGEGSRGMQAVANVIMNRYRLRQRGKGYASFGRVGATVREICTAPLQFSAWNNNDPNRTLMLNVTTADSRFSEAMRLADLAIRGKLPDITGGADHYHTTAVRPAWATSQIPLTVVGTHKFYSISGIA